MDLYGQKNTNTIAVGIASLTRYSIQSFATDDEVPERTEALLVDDARTGNRFVIVINQVDFREVRTPIQNGIARFTERNNAPGISGCIQLRTPDFYRKQEGGDELDGVKEADLAPYIAARLREAGFPASKDNFTAHSLLASPDEPWILCTSIKPSDPAGAASLESRFADKGPDAMVTTVDDIGAFATQLGIDMAQSADLKCTTKDNIIHKIRQHLWQHTFRQAFGDDREINAFVNVIHGPVHYENETLTVRTSGDLADAEAHRVLFTKKTGFTGEREYRFAVSAGSPASDTFRLSVSPELSVLTKSWRYGDRWWSSRQMLDGVGLLTQ